MTKFVGRHHRKIIYVTNDEAGNVNDGTRQLSQSGSTPKDLAHLQALGICFVKTLLCHCDHIFRRDPEFVDPPTLLDSETEDEDFSEHSPSASPAGAPRKELVNQKEPELVSASSSPAMDSPLSSAETEDADDECHEAASAPVVATETRHSGKSSASRSTRKRKKREHKAAAAAAGSARCQHTGAVASPIVPDVTCSAAAVATATAMVSADVDADESYATMAIAAAAGTLAAVLCVIFT